MKKKISLFIVFTLLISTIFIFPASAYVKLSGDTSDTSWSVSNWGTFTETRTKKNISCVYLKISSITDSYNTGVEIDILDSGGNSCILGGATRIYATGEYLLYTTKTTNTSSSISLVAKVGRGSVYSGVWSPDSVHVSGHTYKIANNSSYASTVRTRLYNTANSEVGTTATSSGTKYTTWINNGTPEVQAWCADFVSWCAYYSGIPYSEITYTSSVSTMKTNLGSRYKTKAERGTPQKGDIVFFSWSHVGILKEYKSSTDQYVVIEGNAGTSNNATSYVKQTTFNSSDVVGFGVLS